MATRRAATQLRRNTPAARQARTGSSGSHGSHGSPHHDLSKLHRSGQDNDDTLRLVTMSARPPSAYSGYLDRSLSC